MTTSVLCSVLLLPVALMATTAVVAESADGSVSPLALIRTVSELAEPIAVAFDPLADCWYVGSRAEGGAGAGRGCISRLSSDGGMDIETFIVGGQGGVILEEPRAMAVWGHELWVADVKAVRVFDRRNGQPMWSVDLSDRGDVSLGDLALSSDGLMAEVRDDAGAGGRFFRIDRDRNAAEVPADQAGGELALNASSTERLAILPTGRSLVANAGGGWWGERRDGEVVRWADGLAQPVDIALDRGRSRVAVVTAGNHAVQIWRTAGLESGKWLENDCVIVHRNQSIASEPGPGIGARVVVALSSVSIGTPDGERRLNRGEVWVVGAAQRYDAPKAGEYLEVVLKSDHPPYRAPRQYLPPKYNRQIYDGADFFIYEEQLAPGQVRPRHSHSQRVTISLDPAELFRIGGKISSPQIPNTVGFSQPSVHMILNMGGTPLSNLIIEFKPET